MSTNNSGKPYIWLTGLAAALGLLMIIALLLLITVKGLGLFWPHRLVQFTLHDGRQVLGEIREKERYRPPDGQEERFRFRVKIGNREFYGLDFRWVEQDNIESVEYPSRAYILERRSWGNFYGFIDKISRNGSIIAEGEPGLSSRLPSLLRQAHEKLRRIETLKEKRIAAVNRKLERHRLKMRRLEMASLPADKKQAQLARIREEIAALQKVYGELEEKLHRLEAEARETVLHLRTVDGFEKELPLVQVVRVYRPNEMSVPEKMALYVEKVMEFLFSEPREANTEGGVFPAIFGTVLMVIIMSLVVTPLGVIAAVYMSEYARQGPLLNTIRIAVNNLAGVPSIVYGIFGLGFFVYFVGGTIDRLFFPEALPQPTFGTGGILWASLTLALLTLPIVIVTTEEGLKAVPRSLREASLALGAGKFETIWKVVLPSASPSIFTGMILAVARAAGEVAPLMVTGVVKLAPSLPIDTQFPFLHLERKFMHLGFHIYDVGFQSPNVEAALPMVYATTLLLVGIVLVLNITAILLRNRLRNRFSLSKL